MGMVPERDATRSLVYGIIGMFAWPVPVVGLLAPLAGLHFGRRGWRAANRDRARVGVVLSAIGLGMGVLLLYWLSLIPDD